MDGSVDENSGLTQLVTSSKVSCLGRLTEPWAACRRVPKMQFRTTTLPTAFRAVPRRLRMTLTKTPRTTHPSGGPRGLRRQLLRRAGQIKRQRFRTGLPQRKQRRRCRGCLSKTCVGRESGGREGHRGEGGYREAHTNTMTVQQDVPRDVGPSAIGRRAKVCRILG